MHVPEADTVRRLRPLDEAVPGHWTTATTRAPDGTPLHWTDTGGNLPPVVLLHGVQLDGLTWLRTAQALEDSYRVVLPDLRGHGRSGRVGIAGTSTRAMVDDVMQVLDELDLRRPVVVGHSMGADVAGHLAAERDLVGVVLLEPALVDFAAATALDLDNPPPWLSGLFATLRRLPTLSHADRMEAGLGLLPPGPPVPWHPVDYVAFVDAQTRFDLNVYRHLDGLTGIVAAPEVVAVIACPILLITARQMPHVDLDRGVAAIVDHWRDGEHVHLPDSGHGVQFEQLGRLLGLLTAFLARCLPADGGSAGRG